MDEKSLQILEFPRIRDILAGYTSFPAGYALAQQLTPLTDFNEVNKLLKESEEAVYLLSVNREFSLGEAHDIREMVNLAELGKILEPSVLIEVQQTLSVMRQARNSLAQVAGEVPLLWEIVRDIRPLHEIEKRITHCISPGGEVLDRASDRLSYVRRRLRDTRQLLRERLESMIREPGVQKVIQEAIITEREGRYVIPVKNEMRRDIEGITHDVSNTGATVFVEPWATVELGNAVKELITEERYEVEKILRELSQAIGVYSREIQFGIERLAELDVTLAKARYARANKAFCAELIPTEERNPADGKSYIKLVDARHPLLGRKAVPLSVEIGREYSSLVITGPNTGGKTVALKTIGLMSLMTQAGIPIPAAPQTKLTVFDGVFADIGDEQSIDQTLSSFSWHITNIVRILKQATSRSLVVLDELGTATDPAEGSALARSILLHFLAKGVITVATTHFSDLKVFAHQTEGMENASFDFDPETLAPNYRITFGIPGGSNALATAGRLGMPASIIDEARNMLGRGELDLNNTLADIMAEKQRIAEVRRQAEKESFEVRQKNAELEKKLAEVRETERYILQEARDKIVREAAELHREIRKAETDLRKKKNAEAAEAARKALAETRARLKGEEWTPKEMPPGEDDGVIRKGDRVYLDGIDLHGTVTAIYEDSREVQVQSGQLNLKVGLDNVRKANAQAGSKIRLQQPSVTAPLMPRVKGELDLRGKRADEVEPELDIYLNNAALSNRNEVVIIHGVATGTVRQIVRDTLSTHPLVKGFRTGVRGEGGEGVTVVTL
ncbi:MAG: endonuclease MutS2 [Dehalococcoidales bacterium]|nr:endonuclease MutS2 [Dehalococcoidales bacterium]